MSSELCGISRYGPNQGAGDVEDIATMAVATEARRKAEKQYLQCVDVGDITATLTAVQVHKGLLHSNPGGAITLTLPSAASLVSAGEPDSVVGQGRHFVIINKNGANTITVAGGAGTTTYGLLTIAPNTSAKFYIEYTNVATGTEAVNVARA